MLYHGRKEVTRMSIYHLKRVIDFFQSKGVDAVGLVIGDEPDQKEFAEALGLTHIECENEPLGKKFTFAYNEAKYTGKDWICKMDSNNVHSMEYFAECIDLMQKDLLYFGSKYVHIVCDELEDVKTLVPRKYHMCGTGQFYRAEKLGSKCEFDDNKSSNFDGHLNNSLVSKFGRSRIDAATIDLQEGMNVIDYKVGDDIHSFNRYRIPPSIYLKKSQIIDHFIELQMLVNGDFSEENYRTAVLEAYLSEKERT